MPVGIASVLIAAVAYGVGACLNLGLYADGIVKLSVYVLLYVGWTAIFKPEAYQYALTVIPSRFIFWKRR